MFESSGKLRCSVSKGEEQDNVEKFRDVGSTVSDPVWRVEMMKVKAMERLPRQEYVTGGLSIWPLSTSGPCRSQGDTRSKVPTWPQWEMTLRVQVRGPYHQGYTKQQDWPLIRRSTREFRMSCINITKRSDWIVLWKVMLFLIWWVQLSAAVPRPVPTTVSPATSPAAPPIYVQLILRPATQVVLLA